MSVKIIVTKEGATELERLQFDIIESLERILKYIPSKDLYDLSSIVITDLPKRRGRKQEKLVAAYFKGERRKASFIEIYLKRLFGHVRNPRNFKKMLPIQEYGLASTVFHEVGHHVREFYTHGIQKTLNEKFADKYAENRISEYVLDNADRINKCFDTLKALGSVTNLDRRVLDNMLIGWKKTYQKALNSSFMTKEENDSSHPKS